jgi:hypothetical protein
MDHHIYTYEEIKLKLSLRKQMEDHIIWIRQFNVDLIADLPSLDKTVERFFKNIESIGNCFRPYFGDTAADTLTSLLKDHITITSNMVKSIKDGDSANESIYETDSITNAENISTFLSSINSCYSKEDLTEMFKTYLLLWKYQFIARLTGDYNADILYFDMGLHHILTLSDFLFKGIVEKFFEEQNLYNDLNQISEPQGEIVNYE